MTGAVRAENPRDPAVSSSTEETLSLSSEMLADNPRDPAAMAASPCTDRNDAVTVVSEDGRVGSDDSCWGREPRDPAVRASSKPNNVLSLSPETVGVQN